MVGYGYNAPFYLWVEGVIVGGWRGRVMGEKPPSTLVLLMPIT